MSTSPRTFRFRDFELDVAAYELRRQGRPVKLGRQPMDLLILLVERRRQLVSRGEIIDRLWGKDVFVDVDTGVNTAISKIRQALRDSTEAPAFVETVPGRGYRFIAAVEVESGPDDVALSATRPEPSLQPRPEPEPPTAAPPALPRTASPYARGAIAFLAVVAVVGLVAWRRTSTGSTVARITLAVLPFENLGRDPARDYLAMGLTDETSTSLAQIDPERLSVKGRTTRYKGSTKTAAEIGQELSVDYLVESSLQAEGSRLRVTAKLIRVRDQEYVWTQSYEREPGSLLQLQQELSTAIAEQVRLRLSSQSGRHAEAAEEMRRARELGPQEPLAFALSAQVAFQARQYPAAIEHARRAVLMDSQFWIGHMELAQVYTETGETDLAFEELRDAARFSGGNSKAGSVTGYLLAKIGKTSEAREILRGLEADSLERYVPPYAMALVHAGLGERDDVFEWLDKAYAARDVHLIYLTVDPKWDAYRADARFGALLLRCGFAQKS